MNMHLAFEAGQESAGPARMRLLILVFSISGISFAAHADSFRCEDMFRSKSVVQSFLARKRLLSMVSNRGSSVPPSTGRATSISNPRPDAEPLPATVRRQLNTFRDTTAQEAIAQQVLQRGRFFGQKIDPQMPMPRDFFNDVTPVEVRPMVADAFYGFEANRHTRRFYLETDGERVEISPRAIVLLGEILLAVRRAEATKSENDSVPLQKTPMMYQTGNIADLRQSINRIEGITALTTAELEAIELTKKKEAALGMKQDEVDSLFQYIADASRTDRSAQLTITPGLVVRAVQTILDRRAEERDRKLANATKTIVRNILLPRLEKDFDEALLLTDATVRQGYAEAAAHAAIYQSGVQSRGPVFSSEGKRSQVGSSIVSSAEMTQVFHLYETKTGRHSIQNIANELVAAQAKGAVHFDLLKAVAQYLVIYKGGFKPRYSLADFIEFSRNGIGDREIENAYSAFVTDLVRVGYSRVETLDSLSMLATLRD